MVSLASITDAEFNAIYPVTDALPDRCSILSALSSELSSTGHPTAGETLIASGVPIRIDPAMGRFSRIEGILHEQSVSGDFIATIAFRPGVTETMRIKVTDTGNADWLNAQFDIVLVMDGGGEHRTLDLVLNQIKVAGIPVGGPSV